MSRNLIIIYLFVFASCRSKEDISLEIGYKVPDRILSASSKISLLVTPSQFKDGYEFSNNKIKYHFVLGNTGRIVFLSTSDANFISSDGYKVGDLYKNFESSIKNSGKMIRGWGYVIRLQSGWNALFYDSLVINTLKVEDTTKVSAFYKMK